jgi:hypothetical protein
MSDYAGPYSGEERDPADMLAPEARAKAEGQQVSASAKPGEEPDGPPQHRSEEELSDSGGTV